MHLFLSQIYLFFFKTTLEVIGKGIIGLVAGDVDTNSTIPHNQLSDEKCKMFYFSFPPWILYGNYVNCFSIIVKVLLYFLIDVWIRVFGRVWS